MLFTGVRRSVGATRWPGAKYPLAVSGECFDGRGMNHWCKGVRQGNDTRNRKTDLQIYDSVLTLCKSDLLG